MYKYLSLRCLLVLALHGALDMTALTQTENIWQDTAQIEEYEEEETQPAEEASALNAVPDGMENSEVVLPPPPPVQERAIGEEQWRKAAAGLDYSGDIPREKSPPRQNKHPFSGLSWMNGEWLVKALQILAVIAAIGLIAYGIFKWFDLPSNKTIVHEGHVITLENVEQYLDESDIDSFLKNALSKEEYGLSVRLYYLKLIKELNIRKNIVWAREKTNRDYLREMAGHVQAEHFKYLTRLYERIWYGNQPVRTKAEFDEIERAFHKMLLSPIALPANQPPVQAA